MTDTPTVARMGFASPEDQNRAIRDIIFRQSRATPPEMGRGREALMNGIEACNRAAQLRKELGIKGAYKPEVYLGAHPSYPHIFCVADNGCGMTFAEARRHLASIGNSGNSILGNNNAEIYEFDTNKGVGVKISLLPSNRGGLNYVSAPIAKDTPDVYWFKLGMDAEGFPGFVELDKRDGYAGDVSTTVVELDWDYEVSDTLAFDHIIKAGHGTVLSLFGDDRSGQSPTTSHGSLFTVRGNDRAQPINDYGLLGYINKRFWELDVKVSVNLGTEVKRAIGAKHFLDRARKKGEATLQLPDGEHVTIRWWIMRLGAGKDSSSRHVKEWARSGHVAAKYKNELYWEPMASFAANRSDLRRFGIFSAFDAIALYVDLDTLSDKAKQKLYTNESRSSLYYDQQPLESIYKSCLGPQFGQLLDAEDATVQELLEYMHDEQPPQEENKQADEQLKKLLKNLGFFQPLDKHIKLAKQGSLIATDKPEPKEGTPEHTTDTPIRYKANKVPITPKGSKANGVEDWSNELPHFEWVDDIEPMQSVSFACNRVECYTQCTRFQFQLKKTIERVARNLGNASEGQLMQVTERHLKEAVKGQILGYIYSTAGFAKMQRKSFMAMQHESCDEQILESHIMVNPIVLDRITKAIQKELNDGN